MLIGITLFTLFVLVIFSLIYGNSFIGIPQQTVINTQSIVNGTTSIFSFPVEDTVFEIDVVGLTGGLAMITAIVVIGAIITLQVVGTGLSENGTRLIMYSLFYIGLWTLLSLLAYPLIVSIEIFGALIYVVLTIMYAAGVMKSYFGGGE